MRPAGAVNCLRHGRRGENAQRGGRYHIPRWVQRHDGGLEQPEHRGERPAEAGSFIGIPACAMPLAGLPSNPGTRILAEVGILAGAAGAVYAIHRPVYETSVEANPPGGAEILSLVAVAVFAAAYAASRLAMFLRNIQGGWGDRPRKVVAAALIAFVVGAAFVAAYPHIAEPDPSKGDGMLMEYAGSNSAEPGPRNLVIRSETTGEIWVIEAEKADDGWEVDVDRDTVYLATIVGLATFGSLVTVRVLGKPKTRRTRKLGSVLMFGGAVIVISYQSFLMYSACCSSISAWQFGNLFLLTVAVLVAITIGFVLDSGRAWCLCALQTVWCRKAYRFTYGVYGHICRCKDTC